MWFSGYVIFSRIFLVCAFSFHTASIQSFALLVVEEDNQQEVTGSYVIELLPYSSEMRQGDGIIRIIFGKLSKEVSWVVGGQQKECTYSVFCLCFLASLVSECLLCGE